MLCPALVAVVKAKTNRKMIGIRSVNTLKRKIIYNLFVVVNVSHVIWSCKATDLIKY